MDSETEELYFQKIHEFIQDDDKIVTIPFLAKELDISIQDSQQLIDKYVCDNLKLKEELGVSRILTGILKDANQKAVMMVKDAELEKKLALFENVLSNIIFSVQKSKIVEFSVVALVDQLNAANVREKALAGSIVGKNCKKRVLNFKKLPTIPTPTIRGKSSFFMPKEDSKSNDKLVSKLSEKQSVESKSNVKSKSNGIASMISKMPPKVENTAAKANKAAAKPPGGLSSFLSKNSSKSSNNGSDSKSNSDKENSSKITSSMEFNSEASIKVEDLTSFMEVDMDEGESEEHDKKVPLKDKKESSKINDKKEDVAKHKPKRKSSKRQRDHSEGNSNKRRKRIVVQDDSDSDDLFEKAAEDEDVIGRSDEEPERVPSPITKKPLPPKNKRRKAVDKTYVDDEGFVVTQTEYVYETASEDENDVEEKPKEQTKEPLKALEKKSSASSENENSSPQRGGKGKKGKKNAAPQNQPTLMNFFKKK